MGLAQTGQVVGKEKWRLVQAEQVGEEKKGLGPADNLDCYVRNDNSTASIIKLNRAAEFSVLVGQSVKIVYLDV